MTGRGASGEGLLVLRHDDARLVVDPKHGGALREFRCLGHEVLRPSAPDATDPFELGAFAMVPYANRIANGHFTLRGQTVQLRPNWAGDPHPLHGQGWLACWQVVDASSAEATLRFEGGGDAWPWRYAVEEHVRVAPSALALRLSVENLSATPMPAMLGLHPYFGDPGHARLEAHVPRVWTTDRAALPVAEVRTPPDWSFEPGRPVGAIPLDHSFVGWGGEAQVRWPDRRLTLRATNCRCLHVYVPQGRDFFCLEPQTAAAGALSRDRDEAHFVQRYAIAVTLELGVS